MNQQIITALRERYLAVNQEVKKTKNPNGGNAGLFAQSSYLRIDEPLVNAKGNYVIDPMELNTPRKTNEKRLNRNDLFVVAGMSLGFYYEPTAKPGAGFLATSFQDLKTKLAAYGSNLATAITNDLNAIYNGSLRIQTGTVQTFDGFPVNMFNYARQANSNTLDFDPSESMFYTPENIALAGNKDQKFTLDFPSFAGAVYNPTLSEGTADGVIGVSLFLQGFLVKNGAIYIDIEGSENPFLFGK